MKKVNIQNNLFANKKIVNPVDVKSIINLATNHPEKIARYNFHPDLDDSLHQMLIGIVDGHQEKIHRHYDKTEIFQVIKGKATLFFYDNSGKITDQFLIGDYSTGENFCIRIEKERWHYLKPLTAEFIFMEITTGPFQKNQTEYMNNSIKEQNVED